MQIEFKHFILSLSSKEMYLLRRMTSNVEDEESTRETRSPLIFHQFP